MFVTKPLRDNLRTWCLKIVENINKEPYQIARIINVKFRLNNGKIENRIAIIRTRPQEYNPGEGNQISGLKNVV